MNIKSGHDRFLSHSSQLMFQFNHPAIHPRKFCANYTINTQIKNTWSFCTPLTARRITNGVATSLIYPVHLLINNIVLLRHSLRAPLDDDSDDLLVNCYFFHRKFPTVLHRSQRVIPFTTKTFLASQYYYTERSEH